MDVFAKMVKKCSFPDPGEHTHFWREAGEGEVDPGAGGHYHGDTAPREVRILLLFLLLLLLLLHQVSYHGYFAPAARIYRIWDAIKQRSGSC